MSINADSFIEAIKNKYNFITNKQVAEHFGVTRARISQWLKTNKIPLKYVNSERQAISDSCLLYTSPSPRDLSTSRMPSSA